MDNLTVACNNLKNAMNNNTEKLVSSYNGYYVNRSNMTRTELKNHKNNISMNRVQNNFK